MKLTYVFSLLLITMFLNACGPSAEEKRRIEQETALVTCSILGEPSNMSAAIRVEKMNDAREKIGGEPFLRGDDAIQEALEWGLCQELVLNEFYDETLQPLKDAKRERIAAEKRAEEQRIAAEKRAEEQRIAAFLPEGEAEDKLLKEFHKLWLAFDYMDACHKARTGYASVYITDSKFKEITSKYTTKRASFIKQSRTLSALEESGKLDEVYKKKSTNPMIGGTPGDLIRMGSGSWNQTLKKNCDNYIWFFYGQQRALRFRHGGSFSSVREVVEYKNNAVAQNEASTNQLDYRFSPLGLTEDEVTDLVVFLEEGLRDPDLMRYEPESLPSGLCVINNDPTSRSDLGCDQEGNCLLPPDTLRVW